VKRLDLVRSRINEIKLQGCPGVGVANCTKDKTLIWMIGSVLLVLVVGLVGRHGTNVLEKSAFFDEGNIRVPIDNLVADGWSVSRAIDFEETKGPAMIWTYAVWGSLLGGDLNSLRLLSVLFFILGVVPLLLICKRCGLRGPQLPLAAGLYVLLPYNTALAQLLMSESSFVFGSLCLTYLFMWGFGTTTDTQRRVLGPVLFGVMLSILLHHRIHAVAFAGGACLVAFERDRVRSWPWWLACVAAGLSRVPLWIRWGGLVSPQYQGAHDLGFGLESVTYLAAALLPVTAVFLWPALTDARHSTRRWLVWVGAATGLGLGLLASPSMVETLAYLDNEPRRFLGIVNSAIQTVSSAPTAHWIMLLVLATAGAASLGAMTAIAWQYRVTSPRGMIMRLQLLTIVTGSGLYAATHSGVYDRYILPWVVLTPILWMAALRRWMLTAQILALAAMLGWMTWNLLLRMPESTAPATEAMRALSVPAR